MSPKSLNRRQFLKGATLVGATGVLAACAPAKVAQTPTQAPAPTVAAKAEPTKAAVVKAEPTKAAAAIEIKPRGMGKWGGGRLIPFPAKSAQELKISYGFISFPVNPPAGATDTPTDNVVLRWYREQTGAAFDVWHRGDTNQAWSLALASGELPEVMLLPSALILKQMMEGNLVEDITDIFESTASPVVKERLEYGKNPVIWKPVSNQKRVFGIAYPGVGAAQENIWWVRQDLLDKAGLGLPKTLDEFHETAVALKKVGAEIPIGFMKNMFSWAASWDPLFGAYGVMPMIWTKDDKGALVYGSTLDKNREVLELLNKWYKEGLISPEFPAKEYNPWYADLSAGKIGMWCMRSNQYQIDSLMKNVPTAKVAVFAGPAGKDGQRGRLGANQFSYCMYAFKKGTPRAKIELILNILNWTTERQLNCVQNADYGYDAVGEYFQFEGYDYNWKGDKVEVIASPNNTMNWLRFDAARSRTMFKDIIQRRDQIRAKPADQRNAFEEAIATAPDRTMGQRVAFETEKDSIHNEWDGGVPGVAMAEKWGDLSKLETEAYIKFIVGDAPVSDFGKFVDDWRKRGGDDVTREVNAWYSQA